MPDEYLTPEDLAEIVGNPLLWVKTFIRDYKTGEPFKPNKFQEEILLSDYRHNVMRIHRRGGKTTAMILLCLYYAMTLENGRILFVAPRMAQVEAFFDELDKFIDYHPWIKESIRRTSKRPHVKGFSNGTTLKGFTTGASSQGNGTGIRGQGAEVILLDEVAFMSDDDFAAVKPIIEGDAYQPVPAITYAASTPGPADGVFYNWCVSSDSKFYEIALPITENPDWTPEKVENIRKGCTIREWEAEYMVQFLSAGGTPFPREIVEPAMKPYVYELSSMPVSRPETQGGTPVKKVWRTMGVDWDKYNRDGSGPNIVVIECDEREPFSENYSVLRVIYRCQIPQQGYTLSNAVAKVIELNNIFNPDLIYVDAGLGELNVEELHRHGDANPATRLKQKVKRIQFGSVIQTEDPMGGLLKKPFKPFMVNLLQRMFETKQFFFSDTDKQFMEQLIGYRIIHESINNVTYSKENEHIIDAAGLACVAMWKLHKSPFTRKAAVKAYLVPAPQIVSSESLGEEQRKRLHPFQQGVLRIRKDSGIRPDKKLHHTEPFFVKDDAPSLAEEMAKERRQTTLADKATLIQRSFDRRLSSLHTRPPSPRGRF